MTSHRVCYDEFVGKEAGGMLVFQGSSLNSRNASISSGGGISFGEF